MLRHAAEKERPSSWKEEKKSNVSSRVEEKASKDETEEINDPELL